MARSPKQTAAILEELYLEEFDGNECVFFRIGWPELRGITGLTRLYPRFISIVDRALRVNGYALVTFDNYFLVAGENDFDQERIVPPRIVEEYLFDADDDEFEDEEEEEDSDEVEMEIDPDVEDMAD